MILYEFCTCFGFQTEEGSRVQPLATVMEFFCFRVIDFRMRPKLGRLSRNRTTANFIASIKQGSRRNITRISGERSPKTRGTLIKTTHPACHLVGQSINIHVYPSKPEGVFVPEGANLGRCVLHQSFSTNQNVDVFSLSPMLLGHNSFPHILQSGNVTSFSFGKPKNLFFEAKSRAKIQRMTGGG